MVWILGKRLMHIIALTLLASCGEVSLGWARRRVGGGAGSWLQYGAVLQPRVLYSSFSCKKLESSIAGVPISEVSSPLS